MLPHGSNRMRMKGDRIILARHLALWIVVVAALAAATWGRIWLIDHLRDQGFFVKYTELADQILAGRMPSDRLPDVSPAYLWLTVALRYIGLGLKSIRTLQIAGLTIAAVICGLAAKRLGGWVAAVAAVVLILGNRAALVIATDLEPETLILLLNAGAILAAIAWQQGHPRAHWVAGLLAGLSAIARPVALVTIVLLAAWALMRALMQKKPRSEGELRVPKRASLQILAIAAVPIAIVLSVNASIAGEAVILRPGAHIYEGNNPLATGAAGVMPEIVADMNVETPQPDYLHVAYRIVAARATGRAVNAKESSRFWRDKSLAYMREYPLDALDLFFWKAVLSVHHYDIYDLITTMSKAKELSRFPAIPFGLAFVLSVAAIALRQRRADLLVAVIFVLSTLAALVAFNVSARQRNALLAPLAVLGGVGVAELVALGRRKSEHALLVFGAVLIATPLLGIEGAPMREDAYNWWAARESDALILRAGLARDADDGVRAAGLAASASILRTAEPPVVPPRTLATVALATATRTDHEPTLFDAAIALQKAGAWREAESTLASIDGYRPRREHRAVSSVAYYRARGVLRMKGDLATVRALLEQAQREAPGDPDVLALSAALGRRESWRILNALHDPFTRDYALAGAWADLGRPDRADAILAALEKRIPEWSRPKRSRLGF